jgi:drug/metabolite transporter (DMT)-like permease
VAVALALTSAFLFGAMTVVLRFALRRSPSAELGAFATTATALGVALVALLFNHAGTGDGRGLALFALVGMLAPGGSQLLFTMAVRDAGPSRTSVVVGAAPLISVVIAIAVLGEPAQAVLMVGAVLVVVGGILLVFERTRPAHYRALGLVFALAGATLFAIRDNVVRWASHGTTVPPIPGAVATLLGGSLVLLLFLLASGRPPRLERGLPFVPVGLLFGVSYLSLFEAYYHGRVTVVSPIVATESLGGVLLAAIFIGRSERIGPRVVAGALCVVAGGALIAVVR